MHVIVWEFHVPESNLDRFLKAYGTDGEWVRLFRLGKGYLGTDLLRSSEDATRFLTVDRWETAQSFEEFRRRFAEEYEHLDARLEGLSSSETKVGAFQTLAS